MDSVGSRVETVSFEGCVIVADDQRVECIIDKRYEKFRWRLGRLFVELVMLGSVASF